MVCGRDKVVDKNIRESREKNHLGKRKTVEQKHEEMLQRIRGFRLLDDDFMTKCFEENKEATELVLRIVLEKMDIQVEKVITQYSMKNIKGRSVRLDIYATDSQGKNTILRFSVQRKVPEQSGQDITAALLIVISCPLVWK